MDQDAALSLEDRADSLIDQISDNYWRNKLRDARTRRDLAEIAMNIPEDRYGAGSMAARCVLVVMYLHGPEMAEAFAADIEHHER